MELTTKQAAERLGVSPQRVRQFVAEGRIKARLITNRLQVINEREIAKFKLNPTGRPKAKKGRKGSPAKEAASTLQNRTN